MARFCPGLHQQKYATIYNAVILYTNNSGY